MKCLSFIILFLIFIKESDCSPDNGFFISAPGVFHVGVGKKVFIQVGKAHLNKVISVYLEHETSNQLMSERKTVTPTVDGKIETVELTINRESFSRTRQPQPYSYLNLVAEGLRANERTMTRVLVSKRSSNIFIQTDQPMYSPSQKVRFRVFILDHAFRPSTQSVQINVYNGAGNRVMTFLKSSSNGLTSDEFTLPDVVKVGTWKISAYNKADEANVASRKFEVKRFVLPSFQVDIEAEQKYILLSEEWFNFTITAKYSYGEIIKGAYFCHFGLVHKATDRGINMKPIFLHELHFTGSLKDGSAEVSLQLADLEAHLGKQNLSNLSELQQRGSQLHLAVSVTNIISGEMQEDTINLPIVSHKYTLDLSRTRSHFLPGYPLDVVVNVRHPDGSFATDVPVQVEIPGSTEATWKGNTDQEGAVFPTFHFGTENKLTVTVSAGSSHKTTVISRASSPSNNYLYISLGNRIYSVGDFINVNYRTTGTQTNGFIYYMVLSRGILIKQDSVRLGVSVQVNLEITYDMVPSFRLIAYYYDQSGNIIADSLWVDVRDECETKVKVEHTGPNKPGKPSYLEIDLYGQQARVALLAVDKAFYGLHADNKLTGKQVFSTMQSFDLGCSYSGGLNAASVLINAGLSFASQSMTDWRRSYGCERQSARQKRSINLQQELAKLGSNYTGKLKECCVHGFTLIPMRLTCQQRQERVSRLEENPECADVFLRCCLDGEQLRLRKRRQEAQKGFGRTVTIDEIEELILETTSQYIRRYFPPSFSFTDFDVRGSKRHNFAFPDSITTWEFQVVTLSAATGFCVVKPIDVTAFQEVFLSLRLPYSVKKYEEISISPIIYNYGYNTLQLAVHMEQSEGLCSPGSATTTSFVNITLEPQSSQFVFFSAVPMVTGQIPIKIHLYSIDNRMRVDAIEKTLNVMTEGVQSSKERTHLIKLDRMKPRRITLDGRLPDDTVPEASSDIFISFEENGFRKSHAKNLLSPEYVHKMIVLPTGCLEQTMTGLSPTASAIRYLDLSEQWFTLAPGARDKALQNLEKGLIHITSVHSKNGAYGTFSTVPYSNWMTALVLKVLSMVAEVQIESTGTQGSQSEATTFERISGPVSYLLSAQKDDGSFGDPHKVRHRGMLVSKDSRAAMTAFIAIALKRSLQFLQRERHRKTMESISRATAYLESEFADLQHPYAVAITVYCLAFCKPEGTDHSSAWKTLRARATEADNGCLLWTNENTAQVQQVSHAITIDATAYALLAAVELRKTATAEKAACWLTTQENYLGTFQSSQDTILALEALAEYELKRAESPEFNVIAELDVQGKSDIVRVQVDRSSGKVEKDLKKFSGNRINMELSGEGEVKIKVRQTYFLLAPKDLCKHVSINVTVEGKVQYTDMVLANYDEYEYDYNADKDIEPRVARSAIELFDARTRNRRAPEAESDKKVTYKVCVSHSPSRNLSGMAIADITLLSGFEADIKDLEMLKSGSEHFIAHFEINKGRVLLYFNTLLSSEECIEFDAKQIIPIGMLQPAPAVFYDYYEPNEKCTVFYSAPKRAKMISKLCSEDVCQCAERPCHKIQNTYQGLQGRKKITKDDRLSHACFYPTIDYAYIVTLVSISKKSNFKLYEANVEDVIRSYGDAGVTQNSVRIFAQRLQCKGELELGKSYLIMGKDGATTDTKGNMQYLLESNTWIEKVPPTNCGSIRSTNRSACKGFHAFIDEHRRDGCRQ